MPHSLDLSLSKAERISSHANKLCFSFDETSYFFFLRGAIIQGPFYQVP